MNLDNKMKNYKKQTEAKSREDKILDTIRKSKETFYEKEQARMLTYWEFLWTQVRMIQKKWWLLQTLLLICVGFTIPGMEDDFFVQRSMGVICGTCNTGALEKQNQSLHGDRSRLLLFSATDLCGKNPALWYSRHFSFNCILRTSAWENAVYIFGFINAVLVPNGSDSVYLLWFIM